MIFSLNIFQLLLFFVGFLNFIDIKRIQSTNEYYYITDKQNMQLINHLLQLSTVCSSNYNAQTEIHQLSLFNIYEK